MSTDQQITVTWDGGHVFQPRGDTNYIVGYRSNDADVRTLSHLTGTIVGCDYRVACSVTLDEAWARVGRAEWGHLLPIDGKHTYVITSEPSVGMNDPGGPGPWKPKSRDVPRTTYGDAW